MAIGFAGFLICMSACQKEKKQHLTPTKTINMERKTTMTSNEYVDFLLQVKKETQEEIMADEVAAYEAAQLVCGSFVFPLYGALWQNDFDMEAITMHLETLYDTENHHGLIYIIFILSDAVDFVLPRPYSEMSACDMHVPILSAAIIEDWIEFHDTSEVSEIE